MELMLAKMENVVIWFANLKEISQLFAPGNVAALPVGLTDSSPPLCFIWQSVLLW